MKKTLLCGLLLLSGAAFAQKSDNVGIGTIKPDPSAILDLNSTSKGLLLPRMTQAQRDAIKKPSAGLVIFQTDANIGTYTFDGTTWQPNAKVGGTENISSTQTWSTQGNAIDATDFLGTTNAQPLRFKVNNGPGGRIEAGQNTFIGYYAGEIATGGNNTGFGYGALYKSTGLNNAAFGSSALTANTIGYDNVAMGTGALIANTEGSENFGLGSFSLFTNTTGGGNISIGRRALYSTNGSNNIGIGSRALENSTGSGNIAIGPQAGFNEMGSNKLYIANSNTATPLIGGDFSNNLLKFHTGTAAPTATAGFVAIGDFTAVGSTSTPGVGAINSFPAFTASSKYRLVVQDGILTEKLKVALRNGTEWADYVFAPNYHLMPLEEVEQFTKKNKHLPNVPSADEMVKEGLDITQTSAKLMEKIEELTLYIIEMDKEIKALKEENKRNKN